MRALVAATRDDARLVILGDRDQLASVEAGAVLADVCGTAGDGSARGGPLRGGTRAGSSHRGEGGGLLRSSEGSGLPQGSPLPGGEQGDRGQTPVSDPIADSISAPISTPISDPVTDLATDPATDPADPPLSPHPPIAACIARLSFSFRFAAETGIGALARAVNAGEAPGWRAVFDNHAYLDVERIAAPPVDRAGRLEPRLQALAAAGYGVYLDALATLDADRDAIAGGQDGADHPPAGIAAALTALGGFRVLCAHRRGPAGVGALGAAIVAALAGAGRIAPAGEHWQGRPVMVTRNDDAQRLYNGDIGLIAPDPRAEGRLRAWFPGPDDVPRAVAPPRLPPHETVFAMSIHKSQGSEFDTVVVVLPDADSPILTRELLYTAITRARKKVVIFGTDAVVDAAVMRRAERASGLRQRLWGTE
jgi:exodeoxyribonuclease V alpha subunit